MFAPFPNCSQAMTTHRLSMNHKGPFSPHQIKSKSRTTPDRIFCVLGPNKEVEPSELMFSTERESAGRQCHLSLRHSEALLLCHASSFPPLSWHRHCTVIYDDFPSLQEVDWTKREISYWLRWQKCPLSVKWDSHRKSPSSAESTGMLSTLL